MAIGSFSAALSGLNANSQALRVVGNNLANLNTVGYKAGAITFQDLVYQNVGGSSENPAQVGLGVGIAQVSSVFTQGSVENTRTATNVAIQGGGFFLLNGKDGPSYTRAGAFNLDKDGTLVTADGQQVQGYIEVIPGTDDVNTSGQPTAITVPPGVLRPPVASTEFSTVLNLNSEAADGATFTTAIQIFDSLGAPHITTMTYTKTGAGAWDYALTVEGGDVVGGTAGTPYQLAAGNMTFDGNGVLATVDGGAPADVTITTPAWTNGAVANTMNWNIVENGGDPALTSYASASSTSSIRQNGSAAGAVTNIVINTDGKITATIGGGQTLTVGQLALANFNNPQGLTKIGSNRYGDGPAAGLANVGVAGTGGRGTLIGSALEQSNVDMAQEFSQMILAQRGYQANGKMFTVSDQLFVDTLNLKQ